MTHYMRFPDEQRGMAALAAANLLTADNAPITASHEHALDVIGIITMPGVDDKPGTALPGWHFNYIGVMPGGWAAFEVTPEQPVRVFAQLQPQQP